MRVTIPSCVNPVNVDGKDYIAVYAATPYGVTNHLHLPVVGMDLSKEVKDQLTKTVEAEVKKQVGALKLAPRDISIAPFNPKKNKIALLATCNDKDPKDISVALRGADPIPAVNYKVENPSLIGQSASFFVSVRAGDVFQGSLIPIVDVHQLAEEGTIRSDWIREAMPAILAQVAKGLSVDKLLDGKETLQLVFFVNINCMNCNTASTRLMDEVEIEITSPCKCCDLPAPVQPAASSEKKPEPAAEGAKTGGTSTPKQEDTQTPGTKQNELQMSQPLKEKPEEQPSMDPTDCNCSTTEAFQLDYR